MPPDVENFERRRQLERVFARVNRSHRLSAAPAAGKSHFHLASFVLSR
jgi:hypothetical protein